MNVLQRAIWGGTPREEATWSASECTVCGIPINRREHVWLASSSRP